ncbi:MAG: DNA repair protein RadA [Chromatiales bacterium]|nr:DNA repair protein RadA [Chromatiales bacterium]
MGRPRENFGCADCGATTAKWQGQCPSCGAWNTLEPVRSVTPSSKARSSTRTTGPRRLADVGEEQVGRIATGLAELDHALGGGLVPGSVVLIGGDPGIGKSTLLIQAAARLGSSGPVLYASGEESLQQISLRARRLGLDQERVLALATTSVETVIEEALRCRPECLVIDSIQTMASDQLPSVPGSPNQLRSCAGLLVKLAKEQGPAVILVGHVTKEGQIAGPRLLEHMVDAVLYFEHEAGSRYRILRAVKNRFGAANEIGIFVMTEAGVREVRNPSAMFTGARDACVPGSVVTATHQGSRPLLVEVQALTDDSAGSPLRRVTVGVDQGRLSVLLAALNRHAGVATHGNDVFINVVGGVRISETAADLAVLVAVVSSLRNRSMPPTAVIFGEVGLAGEIRPVPFGEERLREAARVGFTHAIVPRRNLPRQPVAGLAVSGVATLAEALASLESLPS